MDDDDHRILSLAGKVRHEAWRLSQRRPPYLRTSADRDDMEQDAWLGAIHAVRKWDGKTNLNYWAHQRIRGNIIDELRKRRTSRGNLEQAAVPLDSLREKGAPDEKAAARIELAQRLSVLTDRQRWLVQAHLGLGYGLRELGEMTGVTESRVCQEIKAARVAMGALPRDYGPPRAMELDELVPSPADDLVLVDDEIDH